MGSPFGMGVKTIIQFKGFPITEYSVHSNVTAEAFETVNRINMISNMSKMLLNGM